MNDATQIVPPIKLGNTIIDDTHEEFTTLLSQLINTPNEKYASAFKTFLEHVEKHFSQEDSLMLQSRDPSLAEHQSEHKRVLGELKQFEKRIAMGRSSLAKAYIKDKLPEWFSLHTSTMDSALVAHLEKTNTEL